jgi:8-oxo-dGTP pyrophosphatase MutT (NUDIX family)
MAHTHSSLCQTVEVFIVHKGKVLLRFHDKYDKWLSVGGHVDPGENPIQAGIREAKEEVGLVIEIVGEKGFNGTRSGDDYRELILPRGSNQHRVSETHEHYTLIYYAVSASDHVVPEIVPGKPPAEWQWCTKADIDALENVPEDIAYHAKRALELLS